MQQHVRLAAEREYHQAACVRVGDVLALLYLGHTPSYPSKSRGTDSVIIVLLFFKTFFAVESFKRSYKTNSLCRGGAFYCRRWDGYGWLEGQCSRKRFFIATGPESNGSKSERIETISTTPVGYMRVCWRIQEDKTSYWCLVIAAPTPKSLLFGSPSRPKKKTLSYY